MFGLTLVITAILAIACTGPALAGEEEKPSADLTVSFLSQYIWRGQELSQDSLVIQPSMTIGYKGFSFNVWGNLDTNTVGKRTNKWTETDLTLCYERDWGPATLSGGYIYYGQQVAADSQEVFLQVTFNTFFNPKITVYREFSHYPSWYTTGEISYSLSLPYDMSLDLTALGSYLVSEDKAEYPKFNRKGIPTRHEFNNLHDGLLSAILTIPATKYVSILPQVYYSFPLSGDASRHMKAISIDGDDDQFFYAGAAISFTF